MNLLLSSGHRHEFSAPLDPNRRNSIPRRSPLSRPAFSTPITPIPRIASTYEQPSPIIHRTARPLSDYIPRNNEHTVRFQEPETDTMSDGGRSVANSEDSERTTGGSRRRRRSQRTSTAFHLAQPAPTLTQKQKLLQIRPRLLLQLQRLSSDSRPKPAIDVLPSTLVVPRLAKKFPRMFRGKAELGINDVMVVKSEEYDAPVSHNSEDPDSDEEGLANRDLMAVICQMRKDLGGSHGKVEIVLHDGSVWVATPLPNGLYEFVSVDGRGNKTTARWVKRSVPRRSPDSAAALNGSNDFKFTFSIINPNSRRHPILASLTQNTMDIPDYYTSVSSSAGKYPPTTSIPALPGDSGLNTEAESNPERSTHAIDEDTKILIQVTGIWVALRQGLSPYFKYSDAMGCASTTPNPRVASVGRVRSLSLTPDGNRPSPAESLASTPESSHGTFGAVGGKIRRSYSKASPSSAAASLFEQAGVPKRAVSTGAAFMQRAAARRVTNPPSTVVSDSEGEAIMFPPRRAATENPNDSRNLANSLATPQPLTLPGSPMTTPDTPTRPQRRVQSVYVPSGALQTEDNGRSFNRHGIDAADRKLPSDSGERPRVGRWKAFTNFFRRNNNNRTE